MLISKKRHFRKELLALPVLLLAFAGCNSRTASHPSDGSIGSAGSAVQGNAAAVQPANSHIDPATAGTVSGTIHFKGKAPKPIVIDMAQDPACSLATKMSNTTEQYAVHNGKLANVFVYIKDGLGHRIYPPSQTPVVLDQKGCRYVPHVIGVMVGQPVEFRNSDPTLHDVRVMPSDPQDDNNFDIPQMPMKKTQQHVFRDAGLMLPIRCDYHPWMEAFLNVVNNPFFAVSNEDGNYEIRGLPPGKYTLVAVQEKLGTHTQSVTVQSHAATVANFTFSK